MAKKIIYTDANGEMCVVHPAYGDRLRPKGETEDELLTRVAVRSIPTGTPFEIVDEPAVPTDRTYRNAWEWKNKIEVNMPKARGIHMDRIRAVRNDKLKEKDTEFMKAFEARDAALQAQIAAEKQVLRDIPQTFDLSIHTNPTALKAAWPTGLPRPAL